VKVGIQGKAANHTAGDFQPRELGVVQITVGCLLGKHTMPDGIAPLSMGKGICVVKGTRQVKHERALTPFRKA
jgi:hypothetical protein